MKVENIKAALKARANELKLNTLENKPPVVIDSTVNPAPIVSVVMPNPADTNNCGKNSSTQITFVTTPAPVVPADDINDIVAKHLKAGRDYDRLPNTNKPTLLKSARGDKNTERVDRTKTEGVEEVSSMPSAVRGEKFVQDGQLLIKVGEQMFDAFGRRVK